MAKLIKVSLQDTGGEFTCGTIENEDLINTLKTKIDEDEIKSYFELESGEYFDAVTYDNKFHFYAPNVLSAEVLIEESTIENDADYDDPEIFEFKEIFNGSINESGINIFEASIPYPQLEKEGLLIFTKKYEKRLSDTYYIKIDDEETFDPKNIYVGYSQLEEVMDYVEDAILECFLYIPKNDFESYLKKSLEISGEEFDENNLENDYDYVESLRDGIWMTGEESSEFLLLEKIKETIKEKHLINSFLVEGKGEWENDYLKIMDSDEEVLYEEGSY